MISHTPVFCYRASFSSVFSRKDFLWNLFIKRCPVASMNLDLKQTQNMFVKTVFPQNSFGVHSARYGKSSTAKVLPLFQIYK